MLNINKDRYVFDTSHVDFIDQELDNGTSNVVYEGQVIGFIRLDPSVGDKKLVHLMLHKSYPLIVAQSIIDQFATGFYMAFVDDIQPRKSYVEYTGRPCTNSTWMLNIEVLNEKELESNG